MLVIALLSAVLFKLVFELIEVPVYILLLLVNIAHELSPYSMKGGIALEVIRFLASLYKLCQILSINNTFFNYV
jgi:hypothetical protein